LDDGATVKAFSRMSHAFFGVRELRIAVGAVATEGAMNPEDLSPSWVEKSKSYGGLFCFLACKHDDSGSIGTVAPTLTPGKLDCHWGLLHK
jgi:hypothetical protein